MSYARGYTLIELLTSIALGMMLSVLATSTFFQVRAVLRRTLARLEMHNTARFVYQAFQQDIAAMQQEGALYVETRADSDPDAPPGDGRHDGQIRMTFLRGKIDNVDFTSDDDGVLLNSDLVWTQWRWDQRGAMLSTGSSSRSRTWDALSHWRSPQGRDFGGHSFAMLPQPRRSAGAGAQARLDDNAFGSGDPSDVGDYGDLAQQVLPVTRNVRGLELQIVLNDGSLIVADGNTTRAVALDGVFVDGRVPASGTRPHLRRPRLFRLRFELNDPETKLTQSFSFSFQAPAQLPSL
jgi:hypothetical protein